MRSQARKIVNDSRTSLTPDSIIYERQREALLYLAYGYVAQLIRQKF
jgi:hypothetical protein